jgi:DNA-directed RNA polymerase subunit RPC12/RpoP
MTEATPNGRQHGLNMFEKSCAYCGARFRVLLSHGPFADHLEEYGCPECGKRYETGAAHAPKVELLLPRRDGKRDRYQDTLF